MKWLKDLFNGGGTIKKAVAVLALVTATSTVFIAAEVRMSTKITEAADKIVLKMESADIQLIAGMEKFQQTTDLRWAMQRKEVAKGELRQINKQLRKTPTDPDLLDDKKYWFDEKKDAELDIRRLLKPKVRTPGHTGITGG